MHPAPPGLPRLVLQRTEDPRREEIGTWVVMADPEGNVFCLVAD